MEPDWVVRLYNQRGTAEQHIKEGKFAFRLTRLSCRGFPDNQVRLQLHALGCKLATFLRCIELPEDSNIGARAILATIRHLRAPPSCACMSVTMIRVQTKRKPLERSARGAEKRYWRGTSLRLRGPVRPVPAIAAAADDAPCEKRSISGQAQATRGMSIETDQRSNPD
jgi:hypothetical protein